MLMALTFHCIYEQQFTSWWPIAPDEFEADVKLKLQTSGTIFHEVMEDTIYYHKGDKLSIIFSDQNFRGLTSFVWCDGFR